MSLDLKTLIRDIPDFPTPGVQFKDITPLLFDRDGFRESIRRLAEPWRGEAIELVAGVEARGFIFAAAVALELGAGFVPLRKPGKLPARTRSAAYQLEYGDNELQLHEVPKLAGKRVLLIDDVIATGGTLDAARWLVLQSEAELVGIGALIELPALNGRRRAAGTRLEVVLQLD